MVNASHDRFEPKLRIRASGMNGSGYAIPTRPQADGKPLKVPGVTTVLKALSNDGIVAWSVDQTAHYAVNNVDQLLNRTKEQGFRFLRYYSKRKVDFDDPEVDIHNAYEGVLNDLANIGTLIHDAVAYELVGEFGPDFTRDEQVEAFEAFLEWQSQHDIEVVLVEATVFNPEIQAAGTLDYYLIIDGESWLLDGKSSRAVRESHKAQAAALYNAPIRMAQVDADDPEGVEYDTKQWGKTYWKEVPMPVPDRVGFLHFRPNDWDKDGNLIPAFCHLVEMHPDELEPAYEIFKGALMAAKGKQKLKKIEKENS